MTSQKLLWLAAPLACLVMVGLTSRQVSLSTELERLELEGRQLQAQRDAALKLLAQAQPMLDQCAPASAAELKVQSAIVRKGDLRLLEAGQKDELDPLFEDLL